MKLEKGVVDLDDAKSQLGKEISKQTNQASLFKLNIIIVLGDEQPTADNTAQPLSFPKDMLYSLSDADLYAKN